MGSVGLMLPWEHRICPVAREGSRVEPAERGAQGHPAGRNPEDAALAAACQAGDLHAYERLYRWQGARMRNLARNLLRSQSDASPPSEVISCAIHSRSSRAPSERGIA